METRFLGLWIAVVVYATSFSLKAQAPVVGFWEIVKVTVGAESMTPVAKWTRIKADGTYQSGNGWLQNAAGTWSFEEQTSVFAAVDPHGLKDEYGPFTVSFAGDNMIWERMEDGMNVVVTLQPITQLPMATADHLVGLWGSIPANTVDADRVGAQERESQSYLFIRWDRIYVQTTGSGERSTGYWHMHGHKPELTLLSHQKGKDAESWKVSVDEHSLILTGISDSNREVQCRFERLHSFSEQ